MKEKVNNFDTADINICQTFSKTAVHTAQLSNEALHSMISVLKLYLKNKGKPDAPKLLTVKECCEFLSISKPTLYALVNKGELTIYKVGRSSRLLESDIYRLIEGDKTNDSF